MISTKEQLENKAIQYGLLPFFRNNIKGFSVEEMAAPGKLFGLHSDEEGCWEWKGPVIRNQTTAYGKFFNKKAGFVSLEFLPHFLNYRRAKYPVTNSIDRDIYELIQNNQGLTSTELKRLIFGNLNKKRNRDDLIDILEYKKPKRHSLESSLQRLQMGGHILIADFEYKYTKTGQKYGWGVALYSTPEIWFERNFKLSDVSPKESIDFLISTLSTKLPDVKKEMIEKLIK